MNKKNVKSAVIVGLLTVMSYIGAAQALEVCTQVNKCVYGPAGSSVCGFVTVCHEVQPTAQ